MNLFVVFGFLFFLFVGEVRSQIQGPACVPANCANGGICTPKATSCLCPTGFLGPTCNVKTLVQPLQCSDSAGNLGPVSANSIFCMQHAFSNNSWHVSMYGKQNGYVSVMLANAGDGMTGGYDWVGIFCTNTINPTFSKTGPVIQTCTACNPTAAVPCDNPLVTEEISPGLVTPTPVSTGAIYASAGLANGTWTHVQFSRTIASTGLFTVPMAGLSTASWALGGTMQYNYHGGSAKNFAVQLDTGVLITIPPVNYMNFSYTPTLAFVIIMVFFGLLFLPAFMRSQFFLGRCLNSSRPLGSACFNNKLSQTIDLFTLDAIRTFSELLIVEYMVLVAFAIYILVVIGLGVQQYQAAYLSGVYVWAHVTGLTFAMSILPITRYSIFAPIFASSFERLIKVHRWLGRISYAAMWLHFITMVQLYPGRIFENMPIKYGDSVVSGTLSFIFLNILIVTSITFVRRKYFEVFYYTHIVMFFASFAGGLVHSVHFRYYAAGPLLLWFCDRFVRAIKSHLRSATLLNAKVHVSPDTSTVTELEIDISFFSYKPGQYVFLNVPKCSKLEWHPISISSYNANTPSVIRLHVIDVRIGEWSNALAQYARRFENKLDPYLLMKVDGPHGEFQVEPEWYRVVVLCGGGIGVTPMLSTAMFLFEEIINKRNPHFSRVEAVHLIFTSKQSHHLEQWFPADLNKLRTQPNKFRVHLFASGKPAQKQHTEVVRHRSTMMVPNKPGASAVAPPGALAAPPSHRSNPSVSLTVSPLNQIANNNQVSIPMQNLSPNSNHLAPSQGSAEGELDDDWQEYDNEKDQYTEYKMQYAAPKYWYNVKTGETSLSRPVKMVSKDGRRPTVAPPQNSRIQVTQYFSAEQLIQTQTQLPDTNIQFGRPDFLKLFGELKRENPPNGGWSNPSCAVFMCGPVPFMDSVQAAADAHGFHTHRETFGF